MNRPGTTRGNWEWRLRRGQMQELQEFSDITGLYGRR